MVAVAVAVALLLAGAALALSRVLRDEGIAAPGTLPSAPSVLPDLPGAGTTGVPDGVALSPMEGVTVTEAGTVLDGRDVSGAITVNAADVVIRNSRITGDGSGFGVLVRGGSVTILDSEISAVETAISGSNWMGVRIDIHGVTGDGVKLGSNVTLQDSWIHDPRPASDAHLDGAQMTGGVTNLVLRNNTITMGAQASAALFLAPDLGPSTDGPILVEDNLFGGGAWTLQCVDGADGRYVVGGITIRGNRFLADGTYGAANVTVPVTWEGNVWDATGEPVEPGEAPA